MRRIAALLSGIGLFFLYFFGLTRTGLVGPDEPRYAAIGRAMASTGDWITPRLWGQPWFEKPALLYWMTAAGFKAGLGADWAPRLPVALLSVAFLIYFFVVLRREFGDRAAWYSAAILATSAGWLVYSHVAITDLPMTAAFAAAMLSIAHGTTPSRSRLGGDLTAPLAAGVFLGLAVLAKGLVPLVLFIPALWFLRHRVRDLAILFAAAALVRNALVCAGHLAQRYAISSGVFLETSFRQIREQHSSAWPADLVLHTGLARRTLPLGSVAGAAVQPAPLSGSPRPVSARVVRMGLRIFLRLSQQAAGLPAAIAAGRGGAHGDRALRNCAGQNLAGCLRASVLHRTPLDRSASPSPGERHFSRVRALHAMGIFACSALAVGCALGRRDLAVALVVLGMAVSVWDVMARLPRAGSRLSGRPLWLAQGQSITCLSP